MSAHDPNDQERQLERLIDGVLRQQPPLTAPRGLQARVLAEIERRAALPWWRKQFSHWPLAARMAFVLAAAGFAKLAVTASLWIATGMRSSQLTQAVAPEVTRLQTAHGVVTAMGDFGALLIRSIPSFWIYGGLFCIAALYVALFGLGAVAYRTLYAHR